MRKKHLAMVLTVIGVLSLPGCGKDKVDPTEPSPLETIAPETKSDLISDKLDEPSTEYQVPTIGTKYIQVDIEETNENGDVTVETVTENVGIVETLAPEVKVETQSADESQEVENLRPDVIVDKDQNISIESAKVEVDEDLTEEQQIAMDSIISYWQSESTLGEDYLDSVLSSGSLSSLSDESKQKIKDTLMKYYPHTNTVPYEQVTSDLYNW